MSVQISTSLLLLRVSFEYKVEVEVLSICIKNNNKILGVEIGGRKYKITQLADDTTLFLKDINSLKESLEMLTSFKKISGLKLNESKTEVLQIGTELTSNYTLLDLKWEKEKIYALGSWFYIDYKRGTTHTFEDSIALLINSVKTWSSRNLTWLGKNNCN